MTSVLFASIISSLPRSELEIPKSIPSEIEILKPECHSDLGPSLNGPVNIGFDLVAGLVQYT